MLQGHNMYIFSIDMVYFFVRILVKRKFLARYLCSNQYEAKRMLQISK